MSLITKPEIQTIKKGPFGVETAKGGPGLKCVYYEFIVDASPLTSSEELTDEEILTLTEKAGTFDFLNDPEEDIYNLTDGTPI